jgi:hypothetical protein
MAEAAEPGQSLRVVTISRLDPADLPENQIRGTEEFIQEMEEWD